MQRALTRSRAFGIGLYAGGLVLIVLAWFASSGISATTNGLPGILNAYGRLAGLIAVYCFLWQLLMMARIPLLEVSFGLDGLTRLHRLNGYAGFALLITHPFALSVGYGLPAHLNPLTQYLTFITTFSDVLKAFISYWLFWIVVLSSIYISRQRLSFETWYFVHMTTYIAILLAFGHQLSVGGDFLSHPLWKLLWTAFYVLTFGLVTWYRLLVPVWQSYRQCFTVAKVIAETDGVTSVYIRLNNPRAFRPKAGQFIILRFLTKGRWYQAHPYSLSMMPNNGLIRITARASGDFSRELANLKPGVRVVIEGPYGVFTAAAAATTKRLYIGGGIGITPLRCMMEEAPAGSVLIYAARTGTDFALLHELQAIAATNSINIHAITSHTRVAGLEFGQVSAEFIQSRVLDVAERDVYVCGPPPMMDAVEAALISLRVPVSQIHTERFAFAGPPTKRGITGAVASPVDNASPA